MVPAPTTNTALTVGTTTDDARADVTAAISVWMTVTLADDAL
jgi:hypothetical protein